jgi:Fic family protein
MTNYKLKKLPPNFDFNTTKILKALANAKARLFELKGYANIIPNQNILLSSLTMQEAKNSSAIENIITTNDELYKAELREELFNNPDTKEVQNYSEALLAGWELIKKNNILNNSAILKIQSVLEKNDAGYRKLPGTSLKNQATGETIYTPPQNHKDIVDLLSDLLIYINDDALDDLDCLIKVAIIHFQFESIHPFYDGNGRTSRIIIILYLILKDYLNIPILYLSRFLVQNKSQYYKLIQDVRDNENWENWVVYILEGIEITAIDTTLLISQINQLMREYKNFLRDNFGFYSQDLLNNLFKHPYTKIEFLQNDLGITRQTASKYLKEIAKKSPEMLKQVRFGKFTYYVNVKLFELFSHERNLMLTK